MKLLKSFSIYTLTTFIDKGIGFILLPIFTYYLSPEDYGQLELLVTFVAIITPFILLQIKGAISVEYFKLEVVDFKDYFKSALINPIIAFLVVTCFFLFIYKDLSEWIKLPSLLILLIPFLSFIKLFPELIKVIYQIKEKPIPFSIFSNTQSTSDLSFSLLFVVFFLMGFQGRVLGMLSSGVIFSLIAIYLLYKQGLFKGKVIKKHKKSAFQFGYRLIPHVIGAWVINASDRIFIAKMVSNTELGIYSVGYKIGSIIMVLELAISQAWIPFLFKKIKENTEDAKRKIVLVGYGFAVFLLVSLIGLTILTPLLYKFNILEGKYAKGSIYVFWVGLGYVFLGFYKIFTGFIFYFKKTKILTYLSIINIVVNLCLNYFLIKKFGAIGAAYATTISFLIFFFLVAIIGNKIYPLPWLHPFKIIKKSDD